MLAEPCGYENGTVYDGKKFDTTRELPCNTKLREGGDESIRITSEEYAAHPSKPNDFSLPVFNIYECGLDAECVNNKCSLLLNDDVKCR